MDDDGKRVKLRCVNWAGHLETTIPEGLHKQSIDTIADFIHHQGFNCVRLTYAIDYALSPNVTVSDAFTAAAGATGVSVSDMNDLYSQVVEHNTFASNATTQDVFGAVVSALWDRGVMTILDNHVSKPSWCCRSLFSPHFF